MNTELKTLSSDNLRILISQTEETLTELKSELGLRDKRAQEREVHNLDQHMKSAELSLRTIQDFLKYLLEESKSTRQP